MGKLSVMKTFLEEKESGGEIIITERPNLDDLNFRKYADEPGRRSQKRYPVCYQVAPRNGIYNVERLNQFLKGLVPGLKPDKISCFSYFVPDSNIRRYFKIGTLDFSENVGLEMDFGKKIILTDEELLKHVGCLGFANGVKKIQNPEIDYYLDIKVVAYPDELLARSLANHEIIEVEKLREFHTPLTEYGR